MLSGSRTRVPTHFPCSSYWHRISLVSLQRFGCIGQRLAFRQQTVALVMGCRSFWIATYSSSLMLRIRLCLILRAQQFRTKEFVIFNAVLSVEVQIMTPSW